MPVTNRFLSTAFCLFPRPVVRLLIYIFTVSLFRLVFSKNFFSCSIFFDQFAKASLIQKSSSCFLYLIMRSICVALLAKETGVGKIGRCNCTLDLGFYVSLF